MTLVITHFIWQNRIKSLFIYLYKNDIEQFGLFPSGVSTCWFLVRYVVQNEKNVDFLLYVIEVFWKLLLNYVNEIRNRTTYIQSSSPTYNFHCLIGYYLTISYLRNIFLYLSLNCYFSRIHTKRCEYDGETQFHQIFL